MRGDEVARDDEENINTDKSARKSVRPKMVENYASHCNRPQRLNICPESALRRPSPWPSRLGCSIRGCGRVGFWHR